MERRSKEIETAKELILKTFSFLESEYLYSPEFKIEESAVFDEYASLEYTNEIKRRNVHIGYTKGKVYGEIKYTFSLNINRLPNSGWQDMISLSNYLKSKNKDFNTSMINEFDAKQAEGILQNIAAALQGELSTVIEGTVWYETYYPRKD